MCLLFILLLFCLFCFWLYVDQCSEVEVFQLENGMGVLFKFIEQYWYVLIWLVVGVGFVDFLCYEKQLLYLFEYLFFSGLDGGDEVDLEVCMQVFGG